MNEMNFDLGYAPHGTHDPRPGYRGTSLQEFNAIFTGDEACLKWIFDRNFGANFPCDRCGKPGKWYRISSTQRFQHPCGKSISPKARTLFEKTRIPLKLWFYAMLHFSNSTDGVNAPFLSRQLGISQSHAHGLGVKIRKHMAAIDMPKKVGGVGKEVIVRLAKFDRISVNNREGLNRASGFFVADDTCVQSTVIGKARRPVLRQAIERKVAEGSVLRTDCSWTYSRLTSAGTRGSAVDLVPSYMINDPNRPDTIRSFMYYFRRPMRNNYRRVDRSHLWMYLKEFEFRYNRRKCSHSTFWDLIETFPPISTELGQWNMSNSHGATGKAR